MESSILKKFITICLAAICVFSAMMATSLAWQNIQHKSNEFNGVTLPEIDSGDLIIKKKVIKLGEAEATGRAAVVPDEEDIDEGDGSGDKPEDGAPGNSEETGATGAGASGAGAGPGTSGPASVTPDPGASGGSEQTTAPGEGGGNSTTPGEGAGNSTTPGEGGGNSTTPGEGGGNSTTPGEGGGNSTTPGEGGGNSTTPGEGNGGGGNTTTPGNGNGGGGNSTTPGNGGGGGGNTTTPGNSEGTTAPGEGENDTSGDDGNSDTSGENGGNTQIITPVTTGQELLAASVEDQVFEFTVTFEDLEDRPVTVVIEGQEQTKHIIDEKLTVELKDGQTAVIKNIPIGTKYSVVEKPLPGYLAIGENKEGVIPKGSITAKFTNYYCSGEAGKLIVEKIATGEGADLLKEFQFTVTINGNEQKFTLKHGQTKVFELPKGAIYNIKEDNYTGEGYDPSVTIEVYRDENGVIVVKFKQINNYTRPAKATVTPAVKKIITGNPSESVAFQFKLAAQDNAPMPAGSANGEKLITITGAGEANFGPIDFTAAGTYKYTISEIQATRTGWTYDTAVYTMTVVVTRQGAAFIAATTMTKESVTQNFEKAEFTNKYEKPAGPKVSVTPPVKKLITGNPSEAVAFQFKLAAQANAPMPAGSTGGEKLITITGAGEANFGPIEYTEAGTYKYTVSEVQASRSGWTYDTTVYTMTVVVTEQNNTLTAAMTFTKQGATDNMGKAEFTNKYDKPTVPEVTVNPPVRKVITGNPTETLAFKFRLVAHENAPMPANSSGGEKLITISGAGEADFGPIVYAAAGTYKYTISEVQESNAGWTYDTASYTMTVVVTANAQNNTLTAATTITRQGATESISKAEFTNRYDKPGEPPQPPPKPPEGPGKPVTGDENNLWIWAAIMILSALALRYALLYQRP